MKEIKIIQVKVIPNSKKTEIVSIDNNEYIIKVS